MRAPRPLDLLRQQTESPTILWTPVGTIGKQSGDEDDDDGDDDDDDNKSAKNRPNIENH